MLPLSIGEKYLLDGKIEVIILKPVNRSLTMYKVEVPGQFIELVDRERLTEILKPVSDVV